MTDTVRLKVGTPSSVAVDSALTAPCHPGATLDRTTVELAGFSYADAEHAGCPVSRLGCTTFVGDLVELYQTRLHSCTTAPEDFSSVPRAYVVNATDLTPEKQAREKRWLERVRGLSP